jgi:hypothetical protein
MYVHRAAVLVFLGFGLACAGLEIPGSAPPPEPVDPRVEALLAAEDPDGTRTGDDKAMRIAALTSFVNGAADLDTWQPLMIDCLAAKQCTGVEAAYAQVKSDYAAKPALDVVAPDAAWAVLVFAHRGYAPPDDWATTKEAYAAEWTASGVQVVELAPGQTAISVTPPEAEPLAFDLTAALPSDPTWSGIALVDADTAPEWLGSGEPATLQSRIAQLTGKCPVSGCTEGITEPAPTEEAAPSKTGGGGGGRKAPAPEPAPIEAPPPPPPPPPPAPVAAPVPHVDLDTIDDATKGKKGGKKK